MGNLDTGALASYLDSAWDDSILPSLTEYVAIPNKSPLFDPDWSANGYMQQAVDHVLDWVRRENVPGLEIQVHELEDRTPTITLRRAGEVPGRILIYGHLDKQPEFNGWEAGLGPWEPVIREDKLYGRGGADDGYAIYAAVAAMKALLDQDIALPEIYVLIECSEESGSPDLAPYLESLAEEIGEPDLVIALDSTCGDYDRLWLTTSLRGMIIGDLSVQVLNEGAHSGAAGGIVPSSFRILRSLVSRIEDEATGEITPDFLNDQVPQVRRSEAETAGEILDGTFEHMFHLRSDLQVSDPTELVIGNTWQASLEVTGIDGAPTPEGAGNVLRPMTRTRLALRLPPTVDADTANTALTTLLEGNPPHGAEVRFHTETPNPGWHAPILTDALRDTLETASANHFGESMASIGCGGSIPFMDALNRRAPKAQFMVTGVLGPMSNAHGPNEFLHLTAVRKLNACVAEVIARVGDWRQADA